MEKELNQMMFEKYIGIDYSGAETSTSRLKGLQVYNAIGNGVPVIVKSPYIPENAKWNWCRKEIAQWLIEQVDKDSRFIVGIDHGFSFPLSYMGKYNLSVWDSFLDDFNKHWPTNQDDAYVDFFRDGNERTGSRDEFRLTEKWTSSAKSVFQMDGPGQVGKSTHTGIPWLQHIRKKAGNKIHFWPFDGWDIPTDKHVIVEVYPSIFKKRYQHIGLDSHNMDAYSIARWLSETDKKDLLDYYFNPCLTEEEKRIAKIEGWILGIA